MAGRKPDFIIIGAMKSATTSLHNQLALQKGFLMSEPKEPNFFSNDEIYSKGKGWYLNLFQNATDGDICGESSTHYTKLPTYPETINRMGEMLSKDTKFIYIMRHPIDRLVSQYIHEWSQGNITVNINEAVKKHPELIDYSRYATQLRPFIDKWGINNLHVIFFENIRMKPQEELKEVCEFLGYGDAAIWHQIDAGHSNISKDRMRKSVARDFISNLSGMKWVKKNLLPNTLLEKIKDFWRMKERPKLNASTLDYIIAEIDRDLSNLRELLSIQITCANWNEKAQRKTPK
ncbi:MAG: sulfotransferase domain-containing protein [Emcibacter sp.]|nr:sulfotransferase domain-containing protein [Emcibacter sp.]